MTSPPKQNFRESCEDKRQSQSNDGNLTEGRNKENPTSLKRGVDLRSIIERLLRNVDKLQPAMALSRERKMESREEMELQSLREARTSVDYKNVELVSKLPAGTMIIKQESRSYREDSDYVRESTETNSSDGSSSTSGYAAQKVRRIHRAVRNKNRRTAEIRRNPMRVSKKDKTFPRPRHRLLSAKRKDELSEMEPGKRTKLSTMPYMNTRSVTRKMYNVGATYQAPTLRDETEWKEWPAHGMHERPVFHPQAGLAVEYLGRYFASTDGLSYREIAMDRPEIEVVSVDPHCEFLTNNEMKRNKKPKYAQESCDSTATRYNHQNFNSCMHESLHCVLGYCSQVMSPAYEKNIEKMATKLNQEKAPLEERRNSTTLESESKKLQNLSLHEPSKKICAEFRESFPKAKDEVRPTNSYTVQQTNQNATQVAKQIPRLFPMQTMYVTNPQRTIALTSLKTLQAGQTKVQELMRTRNPLILLNPPDTKARVQKPVSNEVNMVKLEDTSISDETLMEMSSMYKHLVANEDPSLDSASKDTTRKGPVGKKLELTVTKLLLGKPREKIGAMESRENVENKDARLETRLKDANTKSYIAGSNVSRSWCTSEASEIARILSEYNKSTTKKPAIESRACTPAQKLHSSTVTNCTNTATLQTSTNAKEFANSEDEVPCSARGISSLGERNVSIKIPQGKWRRFHFTVEKLKDLKNASQNAARRKIVSSTPGKHSRDVNNVGSKQSGKNETVVKLSPKEEVEMSRVGSLQELLEDTAVLYCAASGVHQEDLADYIDGLDAKHSVQWIETWNSSGPR